MSGAQASGSRTSMRRYAVRRPVENSYLVRERDRRWHRELLLVLASILPLAFALLANVWAQSKVLETGFEIDRLEQELSRLDDRQRRLRFEASYLSGPGRVEREATELGLVLPAPEVTLSLEELR